MAKRLSDSQKKEIIKRFKNGESILVLAEQFGCTKLTISRNLKKSLEADLFNHLISNQKSSEKAKVNRQKLYNNSTDNSKLPSTNNFPKEKNNQLFNKENVIVESSFVEIPPLDYEISNESRKEVSSIPIDEISFPKIVYMIVNKKIELEIKSLKDYPEWQFLPEEDLNCKTIEIYSDLKIAKRDCNKEQKVIKVPNTNVFKIASKTMISRGISKIISEDQLISL